MGFGVGVYFMVEGDVWGFEFQVKGIKLGFRVPEAAMK